MNWGDAKAYVSWLSRRTRKSYRLLSEAEWEYAARAGSATARPWGAGIGKNTANCRGCGGRWNGKQTAPVGSFSSNRFGLHDMMGNVYEWTEDCWNDGYQGAQNDGTAWTRDDCKKRVLRGGSIYDGPRYVRSAYRLRNTTDFRNSSIGFRVARTL